MAKGSDDSTQSAKRQKTSDGSSGGSVLKFRNYVPSGDELADAVMAPAPEMPSIDKEVQAAHAKLQEEESAKKGKDEDVDLLNLAPQKIDWDLKRDIAPKLEKLERRTQRAIAEIINERLASEKST
eukprot:m.101470 g.101470  ORF g.101470 m.101470 type:complete len:126 (+) comp10392_c0_seq3:161-538(+)